jgi:methylated-DNA-[protein]-cysteine S-methyltransferase
MKNLERQAWLSVFPSSLGWFAILGEKNRVIRLAFGYPSASAAKQAINSDLAGRAKLLQRKPALAARLQAYAKGKKDDFRDVQLDLGGVSDFKRRVLMHCRKIPLGTTVSYSELAKQAGFPKAARSVGTCMAKNNLPIIIPCHRVVTAGGKIGSYSACGGKLMKKRLLNMEKSLPK